MRIVYIKRRRGSHLVVTTYDKATVKLWSIGLARDAGYLILEVTGRVAATSPRMTLGVQQRS